jgi:L-histidine N-alpha-methyltransferase
VDRLAADYPDAAIRGVVGDFTRDLDRVGPGPRRMFVFLAGTIGNLDPHDLPGFLGRVRRRMTRQDRFLVGLDLIKDRARLEAAYNDARGITARFNRNMLRVLNHRFGTDFDPAAFDHVALWNPDRSWIEMRLAARRPVRVTMPGEAGRLVLETGDSIRTEISCKFTRESFEARLEGTGLELDAWYTDGDGLFAEALLRPR